jgi:hypothetical protein
MQCYIQSTREAADKQWIHDLIAKSKGKSSRSNESILLNYDAWCMCHNVICRDSQGSFNARGASESTTYKQHNERNKPDINKHDRVDMIRTFDNCDKMERMQKQEKYDKEPRYLVIFKDESLCTLRDLRAEHTGVLQHIQEVVRKFLYKQHPKTWHLYRIFFHYMPSVFQLHAHVSARRNSPAKSRQHYLLQVLQNLSRDSMFYHKCLIITSISHQIRRQNLYDEITVPLSCDTV